MVQSIRSLRIFVAVAEELHFRRAAERLHMTQPPVSAQIKKLEETFGVELIQRSTRNVGLTKAGKELYRRASKVLAEVECMGAAVRKVAEGNIGTLHLGFNSSTVFDVLPWLLERHRNKYPDVLLDLQESPSSEQLEALRARELDAALVRALPEMMKPDLNYIIAAREQLLLALPLRHALASWERVPIQALQHVDFEIGRASCRERE